MSYPPNYGYPQGGSQYPPSSSGGIGFEGIAPGFPSGPGYPQGGGAPYPNVGAGMPGAQAYQPPPAANPYCPPASVAPPYNGGQGYGAPGISFGGAAMAASAFRQPPAQNYGMPGQSAYGQPTYGQPPSGYAQPAQGYNQPPQSYQPAPAYQPASAPAPQPSQMQQPAPVQHHYKPSTAHTNPQVSTGLHRNNTLPARNMTFQGTVKSHSPFHPQNDAEVLRKAMKGWGCDEKAITHIMTTRSNKQRQQILLEYKTAYGRDLMKDLKDELSGHYEDVVLAMMMSAPDYDAALLRKAMKGLGTDEDALIEILCTRTNAEIREINNSFRKQFDRDLEKDIHSETSGNFRKLLISQVQGQRDESEYVDVAKAQQDAQDLYKAGEGRWGTDESRFNVILASRSYPQLRATFEEYKKICKHTVESSIDREMSGDLKKGMLTIVKCVKNTPAYFAEELHKSMKGLGTADDVLVRICVSRSEIDMVQIKKAFADMYGQTLGRFIADDTSGNYKKILLDLVGETH